jgi:hypothetical protein
MTTPDGSGFTGFDGARVAEAPADFIGLNSADGVERFKAHFYSEGRRHADDLTNELLMAGLLYSGQVPFDLTEAIAGFRADNFAQQCYAAGLCLALAHHSNLLRGVVALRELGLSAGYLKADSRLTDRASDLPGDQCLEVADMLDTISGKLSIRAGNDLPWQLRRAGWSVEAPSLDADVLATSPPLPSQSADSGPAVRKSALQPPPGTAAARHNPAALHDLRRWTR